VKIHNGIDILINNAGISYRGEIQNTSLDVDIKLMTAIFLHAHLQVVYFKCVKFHKNPISGLGGVALTRYMDGWTDGRTNGRTDRVIPIYPPKLCFAGKVFTGGHY
jgi:NAD(P)-dependent dehydrogenase (short-subunit alcohol dehydrogenase family)